MISGKSKEKLLWEESSMKRILTTMCALTLLLAASVPALAAEPE